jgi:hypothetical protein
VRIDVTDGMMADDYAGNRVLMMKEARPRMDKGSQKAQFGPCEQWEPHTARDPSRTSGFEMALSCLSSRPTINHAMAIGYQKWRLNGVVGKIVPLLLLLYLVCVQNVDTVEISLTLTFTQPDVQVDHL